MCVCVRACVCACVVMDRAEADAALDTAAELVAEAESYLAEVKAKPGSPHGAIWWMERELHEARAYLPTSKGGYRK